MSSPLKQTVLHDRHVAAGAKMVEFAGTDMPLQYADGMVAEHLATRESAGLFDVSHMGRLTVRGAGAMAFLQHVLTNNAAALDVGTAQYTIVPNAAGGAIDDAYLYRFVEDEYLLVINAGNRQKDWDHFQQQLAGFPDVELTDQTDQVAMISLQGPAGRDMLRESITDGFMPEPMRNACSIVTVAGAAVRVGRTGYTGEPLCFELFVESAKAGDVWDYFVGRGAKPVGLGARDTLRLEAALPLYGHEFGLDADGKEIPILACPLARFAMSFSDLKGDFVGRAALAKQFESLKAIRTRDFPHTPDLPRMIRTVAVIGKGVARPGATVFKDGQPVGTVTSGTMVPYFLTEGEGLSSDITDRHALRGLCLAYISSDILVDTPLTIDVRGKQIDAVMVQCHLRSDAPPFARPIPYELPPAEELEGGGPTPARALTLLADAVDNHQWRQERCVNLIPSEMALSPMVRMLSIMDPAFRYAEHRKTKAFQGAEVFYYQGTKFIEHVERLLEAEFCAYLGCANAETRMVSGQMANTIVFSAMVDYLNRNDRRANPRRIRSVVNNHLGRGGHLSAQPMGALGDFVARDPRTERPSVWPLPVCHDNLYRMDVGEALKLIDQARPELIILGKSVVLHAEPVAEIRAFLDDQNIDTVLMYDMAHVFGLVGPHFQQPFAEGADIVSASTHKTFFGTQRGMIGGRYTEEMERYAFWEAIQRRTFPGSLSNHHLGTMLGLLMAAYEMNHFKDTYQPAVVANAKAFAKALAETGLTVAGDPAIDYTQTHQVVVYVGYGKGPRVADRLEANNIVCNYQATPDEEGFTASGALRLGVSEMTRWGFGPAEFAQVAQLMHDVIVDDADAADAVTDLRKPFDDLQFCFKDNEFDTYIQKLHTMV